MKGLSISSKDLCTKLSVKTALIWYELEKVPMKVEIKLNNRPLCYVKDDIQMPILRPMIHGIPISELEENVSSIEENHLRKRVRYIQKCKNLGW